MNRIKLLLVPLLCCFSLCSWASDIRTKLNIAQGSLSLGGLVSIPIEWDPVRQTSLLLNIFPHFGIFVTDNIELLFEPHLKTPFFNYRLKFGEREALWHWGLGTKFHYYFSPDWSVIPVLGFGIKYEMAQSDITTAHMLIEIPFALLLPLNEHIALSFGMSTQISIVGQYKIFDGLRFEPGFFGVRAYF
ncbi:MAG: hypothetical protein H6731_10940 [Myxococcales bacterium]|nr:MAG: hypothetical protein H6731_10940 [Myxococcales bacterium]